MYFSRQARTLASTAPIWPAVLVLLLLCLATSVHGMTDDALSSLVQDTRDLFYHGWTNYLDHAFPEDELKPISCVAQVRNRANPADIGLNDVLGNYSLTLIDSLSTLAILASGKEDGSDGHYALQDFQWGVKALVELYGDGSKDGPGRCGTRACGFDLDSKVQVFETNIRGVGGLLSAHLFAVGELPIKSYEPAWVDKADGVRGIDWPNGFFYSNQLLHLAHDLASRLLPAFSTSTSIPYPRVNLRHGIPFYKEDVGVCRLDGTNTQQQREITETCSAGAGSLVLEFTVLSRLTGDTRFERLAKEAFWAVWDRRSAIGLVGGGLDAESGLWTLPPLAGIGAGIDSFFEYAFKSHILLSGDHDDDSDEFLTVWQLAHGNIRRHIRRSGFAEKHPYYGPTDLVSGAPRFTWIDNLSAYYPGLLTLAGELEEAVEAHLVYAALWTRFSALPERWHAPLSSAFQGGGYIDPNFKHWAGRPEFAESTYYLYQATKDPWYLHVGEMILRDIRRRCWAKCGWADLGDVVSGEQRDRMESFFLGETAKYLFLLFEHAREGHPLENLDAGAIFSTEGHPLSLPRGVRGSRISESQRSEAESGPDVDILASVCPAPKSPLPLTVSNVANRADLFHAAALTQLHLVPVNPARESPLLKASDQGPGVSYEDVRSPTNYTFYPWTLPRNLIPAKGLSTPITMPILSTLTFPNLDLPGDRSNDKPVLGRDGEPLIPLGALTKVLDGIMINSLSNIRLNMVQVPKASGDFATRDAIALNEGPKGPMYEFRIQSIANWALGHDEKVLLNSDAVRAVSPTDPHFTRVKDLEWVDLVFDVPSTNGESGIAMEWDFDMNSKLEGLYENLEAMFKGFFNGEDITIPDLDLTRNSTPTPSARAKDAEPTLIRQSLTAVLPVGLGAAPLPAIMDDMDPIPITMGSLPFQRTFFLDDTLCSHTLPSHIAKTHNILIIRRGGCSFNDKLANIPIFPPDPDSLSLVVIMSYPEDTTPDHLIRPLLDTMQKTPTGLERRYPLAMCMVDGSRESVEAMRTLASALGRFDRNGKFVEKEGLEASSRMGAGMAIRRRYSYESMGVPIGNLILV